MVSILIVTVGGTYSIIKKLTAFIKDTVFEAIFRKRGKVKDAIYAMYFAVRPISRKMSQFFSDYL